MNVLDKVLYACVLGPQGTFIYKVTGGPGNLWGSPQKYMGGGVRNQTSEVN